MPFRGIWTIIFLNSTRLLLDGFGMFMYKVKNDLCPLYIKELFNRYSFRNSDFVIPRFNTVTHGKHSLRYLCPVLWPKLDKKIKNSESLNTFKAKIRKLE